jgi:GntR family transcriptional regulator, transcriptional repressor for pyruvate dehydrogenase complex
VVGLPRFEPVVRRKTYELVAERLLELIAADGLGVGDPLPAERELVERFGVGRSSVREALRMLESRGAIAEAAGGFAIAPAANPLDLSLAFLHSVDQANLDELFEVRRIVEGEAAALAAVRRDDAELALIAEQLAAMQAGVESETAFAEADLRFHLAIVAAARNRLVAGLMDAIRSLMERALAITFHIPGSPQAAIAMHRRILEAIEAGDPDLARERMREHLAHAEREAAP